MISDQQVTEAFSTLLRWPGLRSADCQWWHSGDIMQTQNVSEYMLVLALCLVILVTSDSSGLNDDIYWDVTVRLRVSFALHCTVCCNRGADEVSEGKVTSDAGRAGPVISWTRCQSLSFFHNIILTLKLKIASVAHLVKILQILFKLSVCMINCNS